MRNTSGLTLIELIVVISIIGILAVALGIEFTGWRGRSAVETEIREIYNDIMNARANAMSRNRVYFVTGTATSYTIYEDTNPWPNGDGSLQIASDRRLQGFPKTLANPRYPLCLPAGYTVPLIIDKRGLMSFLVMPNPEPANGAQLRVDPDRNCADAHDINTMNPDYDCLTIMQGTRIKIGKWNGTTNACDIK